MVDTSPNMQINLTIKGEICIYTDLYTVAFTPLDFLIATNAIVRCIRIRPANYSAFLFHPTFTLFFLSYLLLLSLFLSFFFPPFQESDTTASNGDPCKRKIPSFGHEFQFPLFARQVAAKTAYINVRYTLQRFPHPREPNYPRNLADELE